MEITKEDDPSLPNDLSVLVEILTTLNDKGLILFTHQLHANWVIVKTEALLNEINGTLFAPCKFKEHRDILASNTGIISSSTLHSAFPHHNKDMLISFLLSLKFCQLVDTAVLENTNLQTIVSQTNDSLLFFPGLVRSKKPRDLIEQGVLKFGWCCGCIDPEMFLSSRFLHSLLLSIAYRNALSIRCKPNSVVISLSEGVLFERMVFHEQTLTILKITLVELLDNNRWLLVYKMRPI